METKKPDFFGSQVWNHILGAAAIMRGLMPDNAVPKHKENGARGTGKGKRTTTRKSNHPGRHCFAAIQHRAHKRRLKAEQKAVNSFNLARRLDAKDVMYAGN